MQYRSRLKEEDPNEGWKEEDPHQAGSTKHTSLEGFGEESELETTALQQPKQGKWYQIE